MAAKWGNCSRFTISRSLKKLGFTRKKKHMVIKKETKQKEKSWPEN